MLKELEEALSYVDTRKDIALTLLTSECGALCSDLDLSSLLNSDAEKRITSAQLITESVRYVNLVKLLLVGTFYSILLLNIILSAESKHS